MTTQPEVHCTECGSRHVRLLETEYVCDDCHAELDNEDVVAQLDAMVGDKPREPVRRRRYRG